MSFLTYVEVIRMEGGLKEGLGTTATERPKTVVNTRLVGRETCVQGRPDEGGMGTG